MDIRNNKPYNNNQEHPVNIYKRYNNYIKYDKNKYQNDKINYLKKLEKYKPKIYVYDNNINNINNINRNRKLSPLGRKQY